MLLNGSNGLKNNYFKDLNAEGWSSNTVCSNSFIIDEERDFALILEADGSNLGGTLSLHKYDLDFTYRETLNFNDKFGIGNYTNTADTAKSTATYFQRNGEYFMTNFVSASASGLTSSHVLFTKLDIDFTDLNNSQISVVSNIEMSFADDPIIFYVDEDIIVYGEESSRVKILDRETDTIISNYNVGISFGLTYCKKRNEVFGLSSEGLDGNGDRIIRFIIIDMDSGTIETSTNNITGSLYYSHIKRLSTDYFEITFINRTSASNPSGDFSDFRMYKLTIDKDLNILNQVESINGYTFNVHTSSVNYGSALTVGDKGVYAITSQSQNYYKFIEKQYTSDEYRISGELNYVDRVFLTDTDGLETREVNITHVGPNYIYDMDFNKFALEGDEGATFSITVVDKEFKTIINEWTPPEGFYRGSYWDGVDTPFVDFSENVIITTMWCTASVAPGSVSNHYICKINFNDDFSYTNIDIITEDVLNSAKHVFIKYEVVDGIEYCYGAVGRLNFANARAFTVDITNQSLLVHTFSFTEQSTLSAVGFVDNTGYFFADKDHKLLSFDYSTLSATLSTTPFFSDYTSIGASDNVIREQSFTIKDNIINRLTIMTANTKLLYEQFDLNMNLITQKLTNDFGLLGTNASRANRLRFNDFDGLVYAKSTNFGGSGLVGRYFTIMNLEQESEDIPRLSSKLELISISSKGLSLGNNTFISGLDEDRGYIYYSNFTPFVETTFNIHRSDLNGNNVTTWTSPSGFYIINRTNAHLTEDKTTLVFIARLDDSLTGESNGLGYSFKTIKVTINEDHFPASSWDFSFSNATAGGYNRVLYSENGITESFEVGSNNYLIFNEDGSIDNSLSLTSGPIKGIYKKGDLLYYIIDISGDIKLKIHNTNTDTEISESSTSYPINKFFNFFIKNNLIYSMSMVNSEFILYQEIYDLDFNLLKSVQTPNADATINAYILYLPVVSEKNDIIYSLATGGNFFNKYVLTQSKNFTN